MKYFPILNTLRAYRLETGRDDLIAAITVTIMLIPQSLAYAMLAGLPPKIGLYSSILPLMFYAVFGTSGSLAVGPVAVVALMTSAAIGEVASIGQYSSVEVAITLASLSGIILIIMGLFRMGFIVNFISRSVTEGFIIASAILIAFSQLKHILGIKMTGHNLYEMVVSLVTHITELHLPTFLLGGTVLIVLLITKPLTRYFSPKLNLINKWQDFLPRAIPAIMVIITILIMNFSNIGNYNIDIVGLIPNGIFDIQLISFNDSLFELLIIPAALLSIVGYVESISVASRFAAKTRTHIDPNNELIGLGAANIGSSLSGGMPVTGGFSRSVVNFNAGSKTPLSGVYSACFITILVSGFMGFLEQLPKATLAAAIIAAVIGLIDIKKLKAIWEYSKSDFILMLITILVTLFFGVETGISTGIILSIFMYLYLTSKPHMAIIGQVPGTEHFRNVLRHEVQTIPEIIGIRIDERLYFANASYLEQELFHLVSKNQLIEHCILMFSGVSDVDASALESLEKIHEQLTDIGITLHLSEVKGPVMDKLRSTNLVKHLNGHIHLSHFQAVKELSAKYDSLKAESDVYETNLNPFK